MPHNHYGHSLFNRRHQSEGTFIPALMQLMHGKEVAGWAQKSASINPATGTPYSSATRWIASDQFDRHCLHKMK
jgi:hypothetical protein